MRLLAISDLHLGHAENREALLNLPSHGEDWLIVAGDLAEKAEHMVFGLSLLADRFSKITWVPGNHELWSTSRDGPHGEAKYQQCLEICRSFGALLTPEDPYVEWPGSGPAHLLVPMFLLYDYSFRPPDVPPNVL